MFKVRDTAVVVYVFPGFLEQTLDSYVWGRAIKGFATLVVYKHTALQRTQTQASAPQPSNPPISWYTAHDLSLHTYTTLGQ